MSLGEKLKEIRKRFGLSQSNLAKLINVSRQAIAKWELDAGLPDPENLKELSHIFGITIDSLLSDDNDLPKLTIRKELNKEKYQNKISSYEEILHEYFKEPYNIYILSRNKKMSKLESILNIFTGGDYYLIEGVSDLSPYYLITNNNVKLLVNIKNWVLEITELNSNINEKKFIVNNNIYRRLQKIKIK